MDRPKEAMECATFVTAHHHCCSLSSISQTAFTCPRRLGSPTKTRSVPRRQRLRATATPPNPENAGEEKPHEEEAKKDEASEQQAAEGIADPEDVETSDLALPNLRELFTGAGKPGCEQCDGKGEIPCPVCNSKGFVSLTMMDTTSSSQCRLCKGQRIVPCPTCREMVYKSVVWWDQIPSKEDDPDEDWRQGPDGPKVSWGDPPAGP